MMMECILHVGKAGVTPEITEAVREALEARELIKINVLKNCLDDVKSIAEVIADRTQSEVITVIGRKIVLFKQAKENSKYEE
jgi:RNA-binding protein